MSSMSLKKVHVIFLDVQNQADLREKMVIAVCVLARFGNKNLGAANRILPWIAFKIPPTEMVGSFSPASRIWESMEVVVVFPWVPATAIGVS